MFQASRAFFDLDLETKLQLDARNSPLYRGYNSLEKGAHSCTPTATDSGPDLKESFTIGAETKPNCTNSPMHGPNQWPSSVPGFEATARSYWNALEHIVAVRLMRALAMSLDLDTEFFVRQTDHPVAQMVLLKYPPSTTSSILKNQRGCGAHTDCGFLTILAQDDNVCGLEVQRANGIWIPARPIPGTLVVNLGDLAAFWTANRYKSTPHRVHNTSTRLARYSIPFFINVNFDAEVRPMMSCRDDSDELADVPKSVKAGHYILEKLGLMHMAAVE